MRPKLMEREKRQTAKDVEFTVVDDDIFSFFLFFFLYSYSYNLQQ